MQDQWHGPSWWITEGVFVTELDVAFESGTTIVSHGLSSPMVAYDKTIVPHSKVVKIGSTSLCETDGGPSAVLKGGFVVNGRQSEQLAQSKLTLSLRLQQ